MPLPQPSDVDDKDDRGRVLVVGGSAQTPGASLLAGIAALRAGAGKLQLATARSVAGALGVAVPESLVVGLAETRAGEIAGEAGARTLRERVGSADAVLIGPGMTNSRSAHGMMRGLVRHLGADAVLVLDAAAISPLRDDPALLSSLDGRAVITPHAGEMSALLDMKKERVEQNAAALARKAARHFGAVVALKGAESWIATPAGSVFHHAGGSVGLATSGSGDTLAGIIVGLAARGATAERAAVWGAYLHGAAGRILARRIGRIGFLARELLDELPPLLMRLG